MTHACVPWTAFAWLGLAALFLIGMLLVLDCLTDEGDDDGDDPGDLPGV